MRRSKKFTSIIMLSAMIITGLPYESTQAVTDTHVVSNICVMPNLKKESSVSSNSKVDLTISSVRDFNEFILKVANGNSYAGKVVRLTQDIEYDGVTVNNFKHSENGDVDFEGTFDGGNHRISGILSSDIDGLFDRNYGVIKNLILEDSSFYGAGAYRGGIAGENSGTIENCCCDNILISAKYWDASVGGIVGENYEEGIILNCRASGTILSEEQNIYSAGGIAGENNGKIYNSCSQVDVNVQDTSNCGGIAGQVGWEGEIQNCYYVGHLPSGEGRNGGIAGDADGIIANCVTSIESCDTNFGEMSGTELNNSAVSASAMRTQAFVDQLNANVKANSSWKKWTIRPEESAYPVHVKSYGIAFSNVKNGVITADKDYVQAGEKVTLRVKPKTNYELESIIVETEEGDVVTCDKNKGVYTFIMPDCGVYISADFVKTVKQSQKLSGTKLYVKTYGNSGFYLDAELIQGTGKISYKSSDRNVVTVSKNGFVQIKGAGISNITVSAASTAKYKTATMKVTVRVKPKKNKVKNITGMKGKKLTVKWSKDPNATGYQIELASDEEFTNEYKKITVKGASNCSKSISGLKKGRKYCVRIRTFKTSKGINLYGAWSEINWSKAVR